MTHESTTIKRSAHVVEILKILEYTVSYYDL